MGGNSTRKGRGGIVIIEVSLELSCGVTVFLEVFRVLLYAGYGSVSIVKRKGSWIIIIIGNTVHVPFRTTTAL